MSGWLPPGCTDKDIDDAANDPARAVQCDNCQEMFDPEDDEDAWIGYHPSYGDCCQCGKCRRACYPDWVKSKQRAQWRYNELRYGGLTKDEAADQAAEENGIDPSELLP